MTPAAVALGVALVVACGAALVVVLRLRRRIEALEAENEHLRAKLARPSKTLPVQAATRALRTAVGTAVRVREQGVGGFLTSSIEELTGIALADRTEIAKVAAPDGTVTVFFSDIVDSTALNERLGDDGWMDLLAAHDKLVRKHVAASHGHIVKSQGDGFMVVFGDPSAAVGAGLAIQRTLREKPGRVLRRTPIEVRIGLHAGPAIEKDGDYFGRNVALAARVAAQATAGEILVSEAVHNALADAPEPAFSFGEPREAALKGFPQSERMWPVEPLD